jgi:hypothetical protein
MDSSRRLILHRSRRPRRSEKRPERGHGAGLRERQPQLPSHRAHGLGPQPGAIEGNGHAGDDQHHEDDADGPEGEIDAIGVEDRDDRENDQRQGNPGHLLHDGRVPRPHIARISALPVPREIPGATSTSLSAGFAAPAPQETRTPP